MFGAFIGDIIGSIYEVKEMEYTSKYHKPRPYEERMKIMEKETPLFTEDCSCTDDSILTCAIADCLINGSGNYEEYLKSYAKREIDLGLDMYGRSRFGSRFVSWVKGLEEGISFGNGAAMRISPIGYLDDFSEVKNEAYLATIPSHNHPEALESSKIVATSIYLLRNGMTKKGLETYIKDHYDSLDFDLEDLRKNYMFSSKSKKSVPQALFVFLQSTSFEDAIRKAISIGGDTDTIACIVGSLSEAYYGIDEELIEGVLPYLKDYMLPILQQFYSKINKRVLKI